MSYNIETQYVKSFVDDQSIKLPRFQRRATWTEKQSFELAISVFQDYPVGVVIINKDQNQSWLLDGRQRRTALKLMREDPTTLYKWAQKYLKFNKTESIDILKKKYWETVDKYLQADSAELVQDVEPGSDYSNTNFDQIDINEVIDRRKYLGTLLDLILMVHQIKNGVSQWERTFDFSKYLTSLPYSSFKDSTKIDPVLLRKYLISAFDVLYANEAFNEEGFIQYICRNGMLKPDMESAFDVYITTNWTDIKHCIQVLLQAEKVYADAKIGVITLSNATPLDAQNIFSRINSGGTQLTAAELLSAKPFWNREVPNADLSVQTHVASLYKSLEIPVPETIVRWDIAATLLCRIDPQHLLFPEMDSNEADIDAIATGFKLLSAVYCGGISAKAVGELEKHEEIDWSKDIDILVAELKVICEILYNTDFFKYLNSWKVPMLSLLSNFTVLEFITIVRKTWIENGKPTASCGSGSLHAVQRNALILFDRLVFEYATKQWSGSGDSHMARDVKDWQKRLEIIPRPAWENFISGASMGVYNGQQTNCTNLRPVLYYYYVLNQEGPGISMNVQFDVDHIIPQEKFKDNPSAKQEYKDSLCNLALLPKKDNISKKNLYLNEITNPWLKTQISHYTGIREEDFDTYSNVSTVEQLAKSRVEYFLTTFTDTREQELAK